MKKVLCLLLCLMLTAAVLPASAVEYSLVEKLQRQIDFGNGLKGTLTLSFDGDAKWLQLIAPLNGVTWQIRSIQDKNDPNVFQRQIYTLNGEEQVGLTQLYGDGQAMYLRSALLPETVLSLNTSGDTLDHLAGRNGGAVNWYSAAANIMSLPETSWNDYWTPVLARYEESLQAWLDSFAGAPSVKRDANGEATLLIRCDIPADALKAKLKSVIAEVLEDPELIDLLKGQMSPEQQETYLNRFLTYHYDQQIDALPLEKDIVWERELTAMGETIRSTMIFPVANIIDGFAELRIEQVREITTVSLTGEKGELTYVAETTMASAEDEKHAGRVRWIPADAAQEPMAIAFETSKTLTSYTEEDTRGHDLTTLSIKLRQDENAPALEGRTYAAFEPVEISAQIHIHSKNANLNPTTLEVNASAVWADAQLDAAFQIKTYSPWVMEALPTEGARDVSGMKQEELAEALGNLCMNGLLTLMSMQGTQPAEVPAQPTEAPAAPDVTDAPAEATQAPAAPVEATAEPTSVPALITEDIEDDAV